MIEKEDDYDKDIVCEWMPATVAAVYLCLDCYKCWIYDIDLVLNVCKPRMCEKLDWLT